MTRLASTTLAFLALLLTSHACADTQSSTSWVAPGPIPRTASPDDERVERVENGLILLSPEGEFLGEVGTLDERMQHWGVPGVGIALIEDFEVQWSHSWGFFEAGDERPLTADALFHAGSVAKPVSALATLFLAQKGELDLDAPIAAALTSWSLPESEHTTSEKVTLRRLVSHTAGLTDGWTDSNIECCYSVAGEAPTLTVQQMLEAAPGTRLEKTTRVTSVPGSEYRYSNLGYGLLELLLQDITGQPLPSLMQHLVLDPLGMTSSTFEQPLPESLRTRATSEHYDAARPFPGTRHHFSLRAAGGLWTTPADLAQVAIEIMSAWNDRPSRLIGRATAREMLTPQAPIRGSAVAQAIGLGLELSGEGEALAFLHTGSTWGSTCLLWAHPATGQGAVIMTNGRGVQGLIRFEILLALAQEYAWPE